MTPTTTKQKRSRKDASDATGATTPGTQAEAPQAARTVTIPGPQLRLIEVPLVGLTPLIVHNFSRKAREMMLAKQQKRASTARDAKDTEAEFRDSLYVIDQGLPEQERYGFPAAGFKNCAVSACRNLDGFPMTLARGAFQVLGDLIPIAHDELVSREDVVRLQGKTADLRYRGEFRGWSVVLPIRYNAGVISDEQILNLYETAGFAVGVGEWRPERNGSFGQFQVRRG